MKPEAADYLDKARSCLADAQQIATLPLPHIAAREAYLAVYNAAEAYVFEFTGRPAKTHRGPLRANDDETPDAGEFRLEGAEG